MIKTMKIDASKIATGHISFVPASHIITGFHTHATADIPRPRVSTCKNCGAPVHNNICEYCGTEY